MCFQNTVLRPGIQRYSILREIRKNGPKHALNWAFFKAQEEPLGSVPTPWAHWGSSRILLVWWWLHPSALGSFIPEAFVFAGSTETKETALPPRLVFCELVAGVAAVLISESRLLSFSIFLTGNVTGSQIALVSYPKNLRSLTAFLHFLVSMPLVKLAVFLPV